MTPEQTLRERWNIWAKEKNLCTDCTSMAEEFMVAEFDTMLAEDIEKIREKAFVEIGPKVEGVTYGFNGAVTMSASILEERRDSIHL